jgi:D-alanyl-D-alanine carboxypeptidase
MKRVEAGTLSLDEYATCTAEDAKVMEVKMYIQKGERMKIRDLLYGALLESDNDAAAVIGSHIGGSKAGFAALMNAQAELLGCKNTHFENANGLIEGYLHSTPHDFALIAREAFKYDEIRKICQTKKYQMPGIKLRPGGWTAELTNPFFYAHKKDKAPYKTYNIQGGKTGTWDYSNASLLEVAEISGHQIITVVMKAPLDKRYSDTRKLLNYARSVFKERAALERAVAARIEKMEKEHQKESQNEYIRKVDKLPVAKQFFAYLNGIFRASCVKIEDAYKTKSDDVALRWEKRPGADGYVILRSTDGGEYTKVGNTESGDVTRFRDETVEKNHVYKYFVRAYRGENLFPCL